MKSFKEDSGQTLVIVALCMTVLLGFMAMAVDVGFVFQAKRNMQVVADAAAVAGALDYKYNSSTASAKTAACAAGAANGLSATCTANSQCSGVSSTTICVNDPPLNGYHESTGYTEAIVVEPTPTFFMRMFHISSLTVKARAVAGSGANNGCLWALSKSGKDVSVTGSGSISAPNCEIYDDSSASNAMSLTGSGSITAKQIGIVGGYSVTGSGHISPNPPTTGIGPAADPLNPTAPTIPTGTCTSCSVSNTGSSDKTIDPGTYSSISNTGSGKLTLNAGDYIITGDLTNTGSGSLILGAGNYTIGGNFKTTGSGAVTIGSGLYTVGGNLSLTGSGALTGSSVTFYTLGSDTITGSGNMNLSAPTSGPYNGMLIYQPLSNTSAMALTGSGGDSVKGILYAPGAPVTLTGSGSMNVSLDMIVDTLKVTGSGSVNVTNYAAVTNTNTALSKLVMVE
ncbi:MAG: pilus assembly protein TadG-related protein [Terracidiphilus sp.]